ncbi:TetR/AcrR family transcriptional regulator [Rhizobium ruizarguesonis]|jgi:AcrR family transcriptional regulator|uniref:TetR/AcrR family transcriptional regulator n=1 Tax=Rhizobium ruizarguesonis TaxID=2081791 RepID=A0ABY1X638_9HYPH|nr:TetR/AcrR family transcriptional regulator [Rhizobium ruizarguesonis]MBY5806879.1 TetR/AcrR family transcriptional regulator [Rhizobium leguminosarum]NKJ74377.1 TetR family transcriptional regulator [Rhizobium leguminosarum bv. viciae]QJS26762.1 TetR/AcrR family transcriptional regulator [Rhizobium leguminosarum bv. trifolii TA1]MBY5832565.1 TetR/AcrR family transcriptional regulator [Rhizobium leguminosarum]MBY5847108.1 TetR/AcrR family transcriptional regulator [Rhizobium leguminosarum]
MRKGEETRTRILDVAEAAVLQKGFGGTSIEELIAETGITKSGFFYHFRDKNELAKALLNRYIENDERIYDEIFSRARDLTDDPLQSFLLGLKLLSELLSDLPNGHPGCLVAGICYYERLFDREIQEINRNAVLAWRRRFGRMLRDIVAVYPLREPVDVDQLADMVSSVLEGGIVLSKTLKEPNTLAEQVLMLRTFVRMLFLPVAAMPRA